MLVLRGCRVIQCYSFHSPTPLTTMRTERNWSSALQRPKRFYKEVFVESTPDRQYEVLLDKRKLRTPRGKPLSIHTEQLALAVAHEWDSQITEIDVSGMRISGLLFTAIDNPTDETKESLTEKIVDFLDTDTLLYMAESPTELCQLEAEKWVPVIEWVNSHYSTALKPSYKLVESPVIPDDSRVKLYNIFANYDFGTLNGLHYGADAAKSVLLLLGALNGRISTEEAAQLANLETDYQAKVYSEVPGHHDVLRHELINRLSAAVLFAQLSDGSNAVQEPSMLNAAKA